MLVIIKLLSVTAFIGSVFWTIAAPDYEPALATATSLSTFISTVIVEKRKEREATQRQSVSGNSVGVQAGGDVSIGTLSGHARKNSDVK
jgi:hypothetical protein